jgi:hypothetical protein
MASAKASTKLNTPESTAHDMSWILNSAFTRGSD